jgi:hypothetical protein
MSDFSNLADDYIEEALKEAALNGAHLSPSELAIEFAKHDSRSRVQHLKTLKKSETIDLRAAAKRLSYERALLDTHHRLRKIDR